MSLEKGSIFSLTEFGKFFAVRSKPLLPCFQDSTEGDEPDSDLPALQRKKYSFSAMSVMTMRKKFERESSSTLCPLRSVYMMALTMQPPSPLPLLYSEWKSITQLLYLSFFVRWRRNVGQRLDHASPLSPVWLLLLPLFWHLLFLLPVHNFKICSSCHALTFWPSGVEKFPLVRYHLTQVSF